MAEEYVLDASALVETLIGSKLGRAVDMRVAAYELHAPGHLDAEVLSALGRLCRAGEVPWEAVPGRLRTLRRSPVLRHQVSDLVEAAWLRRDHMRLTDALYVELADRLDTMVLTTDVRLARATDLAELVTA